MSGSVREEMWAWEGIHINRNMAKLIPLTIFWGAFEGDKFKAFEDKEIGLYKLKNRWLHYFGFILLEHDIIRCENFENVIDILTIL